MSESIASLHLWTRMSASQTILVVEDREDDWVLMRTAAQQAQVNVPLLVVRDGEEAVAYLKGEGAYSDRARNPLPAVMLLDLNLPKKSGFDVLAWVRSQPKIKRLPIVVLCSSSRTEDVERAYDLGANGFLVKPTSLADLIGMTIRLRDWLEINHFPTVQ